MSARFVVPADHPSLPGHFPGRPVVPGVVVLEHVVEAAIDGAAERLAAIAQVKFLAPLGPGTPAEVAIERSGATTRFVVTAEGRTIAQGTLVLGPAA